MNRPSVDECVQGFERILDKINPQQMVMLQAHYHSGGRVVTMRELATAAGYADYKMANLQYGNLAKRLYQAMGYPAVTSESSGKPYWILGLGKFVSRDEFGLEMQCVMRPEIAGALERLEMVEPLGTSDDGVPDESHDVPIGETQISSRSPEPATQKAESSDTHSKLQVEAKEDSSIEEYGPHDDVMQDAKRILLITGKGHSAESAHGAIIGALDAGLSLDRERIEDLSLVTQNIDGSHDLVELHGVANEALCLSCGHSQTPKNITKDDWYPECQKCAAFKAIVLCSKMLDDDELQNAQEKALNCNVCIVAGSSDVSNPAMQIAKIAKRAGSYLIEINPEKTMLSEMADMFVDLDPPHLFAFIYCGPRLRSEQSQGHMGTHYLLYWQERSVLDHAANEVPLDVVASNGLFGVEQGDTLWIVTLTEERELFLAGRLVVGEIVEYEEAMRRMPDAGLWQAEYYAFPEPGTEEFIRPLPLMEIAEELRFDDENDRLTILDGQINPQQLRNRRKLSPESAELIMRTWEESAPITDPEELVAAWQEIVEAQPDNPEARYNLAVALGEVGRSDEAFREYQETIRLDPNYFPALYNLGNYLLRSQRFDEAIEMFNRAILVDGDYAPVYFMLGVAYFESGRFDDAVAATRQGMEIDPDDEAAYYNIAYWTFRQGDYRKALTYCDDVIARFPYYTSPHVLKGMCFRELGELENEIQSYKNAVDIKVDDEGAFIINFTALFFLGAAWERKITGSDEGIEYIEADNFVNLDDPTHQFCFAMGHLAQGEREYADQWIEGLRTSAPALANRLETALNYPEIAASETHPMQENTLQEMHPDWSPRQADLESGDRSAEPGLTKPIRRSQPRKKIQMNVGETEITAKNIPDLYLQVLRFLVENGSLENLELPISSGRKRNFLSRTPIHKDGSDFLAPVEFGGYYMESHSSRENGIRMLREFLETLGIESSVYAGESEASDGVYEGQTLRFEERVVGSLLGLAVCDALGTTAEFKPMGTFPAITGIVGGGPFSLQPGEWTDDTSMALCLADSLAECGGFDARDQMERYLRWKTEGYLSSNGRAFDIGITIRAALDKYAQQLGERNPFCGSVSPSSAGNGSLMRLAPVPLFFASDPLEAILMAAESSKTTHGARECVDACRYFAGLIIGALLGKTKEEILSAGFSPVPGLWESEPLGDRIADLANGSFKSKKPPQISSTGQGYVVLSLHAALWAFYHSRSFREGALKVVNLGYDSDTYGAIYGQLAGAFYGSGAIPADWLEKLAKRNLIEKLATGLMNDPEATI